MYGRMWRVPSSIMGQQKSLFFTHEHWPLHSVAVSVAGNSQMSPAIGMSPHGLRPYHIWQYQPHNSIHNVQVVVSDVRYKYTCCIIKINRPM